MPSRLDPSEELVISLARQIEPGDVVFTGANAPAAVAAALLARRAHRTPLTLLTVAGGVDPSPARLPGSSGGPELLAGTEAIFANEDFFDLCARGGVDKALLGGAQVDAGGRVNVSAIGAWERPRVRLPGGGGAAMMMPTARTAVAWSAHHTPRHLVERVDFATAAGATVLVTPLAVFRRPPDGRFGLASHRAGGSVAEVREATGFEFEDAGAIEAEPPGPAEREALRELDVGGVLGAGPGEGAPTASQRQREEQAQ